ncbi:unnamed protein product [Discosporangium mesarthrocarpum]
MTKTRIVFFPQESRKHYNQLEEARSKQHARKLKLEAQEVALGERDHVTATMGDSYFLGEDALVPCGSEAGRYGQGGDAAGQPVAIPAGMRQMLNIPAPLPQPQPSQDKRRQFAMMPITERQPLIQRAAAAPDRALGHKRNWKEMCSSLLLLGA